MASILSLYAHSQMCQLSFTNYLIMTRKRTCSIDCKTFFQTRTHTPTDTEFIDESSLCITLYHVHQSNQSPPGETLSVLLGLARAHVPPQNIVLGEFFGILSRIKFSRSLHNGDSSSIRSSILLSTPATRLTTNIPVAQVFFS